MSTISEPIVTSVAAGQGNSYLLAPGEIMTFKAVGEQTGGLYMMAELSVRPGGGPPLHTHPPQEHFLILEGTFEIPTIRDGQRRVIRATAGDVIHMPGGVPHTYKNVGEKPGRFMLTLSPASMQEFFFALGLPITDPAHLPELSGPPDMEWLGALFQKYDIKFLEPFGP